MRKGSRLTVPELNCLPAARTRGLSHLAFLFSSENSPNLLSLVKSCPQRAVFARDPRRKAERGQSAALGESSLPAGAGPAFFLGCMCARVRKYLHSAVTLPPGVCLISHVPGSGGGGEVSLWFSSAATLSIESSGCNFSRLLASLCRRSLGRRQLFGSSCSLKEDYWSCLLLLVGPLCACVRAAVLVLSGVFV